jgi:hypothetical protein
MDTQAQLDQTTGVGISPLVTACTDTSHPYGIHRHGLARFVRRAHQRHSSDCGK